MKNIDFRCNKCGNFLSKTKTHTCFVPWLKGKKVDRKLYPKMGHFNKYKNIVKKKSKTIIKTWDRSETAKKYGIGKWMAGRNIGSLSHLWKGGKPKCLDCEKELINYDGKRCKKCFHKFQSGKNCHLWKGGISKKNYKNELLERIRFRQQIQKKVFERDNYTCQICGERGGDLQVDHIQSWAEYIELRFCIDNCRTLCMACHYKVTFGKPMPPTVRAWGHTLKGGKYL